MWNRLNDRLFVDDAFAVEVAAEPVAAPEGVTFGS